MEARIVWTLAKKELRDALRNRWFVLYTAAFVVLALAFSYLALAGAGMVGFAGFGRTAASLINLVLLIVPLMALTIGAQSLAGEQERNTLAYLLAQPISRTDVFVGKYLGLVLSLLASLTLGFGISGVVMALNGTGAADPTAYVLLVALAFAVPPLARAGALPAQRIFRGSVEQWPWPSARALAPSLCRPAFRPLGHWLERGRRLR
jgi:Cu-processing system permease protein